MSSKSFSLPEGTGILGLPASALEAWCAAAGFPAYRGRQIFRQLHVRRIASFDDATDLPLGLRQALTAAFKSVNVLKQVNRARSVDGSVKLLLAAGDGASFETVLIPMEDATTQCLSSQSSCAMGCAFCFTASLGAGRNLSTAEIVEQHYLGLSAAGGKLRNLVFMGMGEPMLNLDNVLAAVELFCGAGGPEYAPSRITVSTCGWVPGIQRLGKERPGVRLAISLNSGDDDTRSNLMPVNRKYGLAELKAALREYPLGPRDHITFEYVMLEGMNDSLDQARKLLAFVHGLRCKVNLIPFNPAPGLAFAPSPTPRILAFQELLKTKGIMATIRASKGADIAAACGQLAGKERQR